MEKPKKLNFMNDFKPSVHACTGDSSSGKTSYTLNLIINLIQNNLDKFPKPSMEVKELSHLLNVQNDIFLFTEDSSSQVKALVTALIENFPKKEQSLLIEIFNYYVNIIDILSLKSYEEINQITDSSSSLTKYLFIDGQPNYVYEKDSSLTQKASDLQKFMNHHLDKNFVFITSQNHKKFQTKGLSNYMLSPSALQYTTSSIVTLTKEKSKINCQVIKNRFGFNNEEFSLKLNHKDKTNE